MQIILNIKATTSCKINIDNTNLFLNEEESIKLELTFQNEFYIQCFPIDDKNNYLPFVIKFEYKAKNLYSLSSQIKIIKCSENYFTINITPNKTYNQNNNFIKEEIEDTLITYNANKLEIKHKNSTHTFQIKKRLLTPKIKCENDIVFLYDKMKSYINLYIINKKNNTIKNFICNSFKKEKEEIIIVKEFKDYAKHLEIRKLNILDLKENDKYIAYKTKPQIIKNIKIIPYIFMQNIKAKDYKEARKYLDNDFSSNLSNESLSAYFKNFISITTPQIETLSYTVCLVYYEKENNYNTKYYNFTFNSDNKIENIKEIK